ncbi:MAG: hypothetical protein E6J88_19695 [Deltaproteobacteria bacterium]|nr:MAG: hypothetical protein E6J88_19695 [Deltaproteobacteria bacterium]
MRVALTAGLGVFCGLFLPGLLGIDAKFGAPGLTASAGVAGWLEFWLLRRGIGRRIGEVHVPKGLLPRLWTAAALATAVALAVKLAIQNAGPLDRPIPRAILVLGLFGVTYLGATIAMRVPEATEALSRARRLLRR